MSFATSESWHSRANALLCSFSKAFSKLIELGVPTAQFQNEPWVMTPTEDQSK